jgi:hypothetical protein
MAMELVETIEVGSGGASSIEFTSIPQDGVDLLILLSGKGGHTQSWGDLKITLNSDTSANYNARDLLQYAGSVASQSWSGSLWNPQLMGITGSASSVTNVYANAACYFSNYTSSESKSMSLDGAWSSTNSATTGGLGFFSGSLNTTSPVTSIELTARTSTNFVQYSTASLYKISLDKNR